MGSNKIKVFSPIAGYTLAAERYDEREKYLDSFEQGNLWPLMGEVTGKKVLDVGAGTGRLSVPLFQRGADVTALDINEQMLKVLSKKAPRIPTIIGDAEDLPFPEGTFDLVVSTFLIVHLKDPMRFFDEVYRVLKDGGRFIVTNINQKNSPIIKTRIGEIIIESYYHHPEQIKAILELLAFGIEQEVFVKEGDIWVNQIIVCRK